MLGHLRQAAARRPQRWSVGGSSLGISHTAIVSKSGHGITPFGQEDGDEDEGDEDGRRKALPTDPSYPVWLQEHGQQWVKPHRPCNWLGNEVPFPLNPSFKPPPPLSDDERTLIYTLYMSNPEENSVRALSTRFHISIKRLDAILRLKGLEEHWVKEGKPLQTGFRHGMEKLLNVADKLTSPEDWVYSRMDAVKADMLDQVEGDDPARARYQRMFWEPVVEGQEPVAPKALQQARSDAVRHARDNESAKSADDLLGHHHDRQSATEVWSESEGILKRPPIKFVDVGGKFLDPKDRIRRMKESERRKRIRAKKAASVVALSS